MPERVFDTACDQIDATFVDELVATSVVVAACPACHLIAFIDDAHRVRLSRAV